MMSDYRQTSDVAVPTEFLSAKEVCRRLRISRTTLWRMQREDKAFPAAIVVSKRSIRFCWRAVEDWVQDRQRNGATR
ncbi:MAG: helix-turn-helix domain-containing protein [Hyphomonadaceae bacterium]|nr:helix-turn-helix domain-containing protein [Hyphomonadaceae bacterium]